MKILIKFPTRQRPDKFFNVLDKYIEMSEDISNVGFLISADSDDITMNNSYVISKLDSYKERVRLVYFFGNSKSKIQACNADVEKVTGWDILLLASDDMIPVINGYDSVIRNDMRTNFNDTDGVLWYSDGGQNRINTLCILGKMYYERFNYIYHPDYVSLWCDNEFTDVSIELNKCFKSDRVIIEHQHPAWEKADYDSLYLRNDQHMNIDGQTYIKRKEKNFNLDLHQPLLSILTPSVPERINTHLNTLCNKLKGQIGSKNVEHLVFLDNKKRSIGYKREALVNIARGRYIAFVDDDDDISDDYINSIVQATYSNADVITFDQYCYYNDHPVTIVNFSLQHKENEGYVPGSTIKRMPFHVCAWKASIGKRHKFVNKNYSEDWYWAEKLIKESKTEYHIDKILHTYVYNDQITTTPHPG